MKATSFAGVSNRRMSTMAFMMRAVMRRLVAPRVRGAHAILEVGPGQGTWTRFLFETNQDARYTLVDIFGRLRRKNNIFGQSVNCSLLHVENGHKIVQRFLFLWRQLCNWI